MHDKEEIVRNISNHYSSKIMKAFGNIESASKALEIIAKSLKEIYRYFEPSFFNGNFIVCKNLDDKPCVDESKGSILYDKNILLNRTDGLIIIQAFNDSSKMLMWEDQDYDAILKQKDTLTYFFSNNKESFFANGEKIEITIYNKGSRFATQYNDLVDALTLYSTTKIYSSSCKHFSDSWADPNRIFFQGGGSGSNIPEMFMQLSLHEFLSTYMIRGVTMESAREYNVMGDFSKPKPVDVKIHWREANRTALIEVKFIGTIKKNSDGEIYEYKEDKVNKGMFQLHGYHNKALSDTPMTIIKSYLVVIDGRRKDLRKDLSSISHANGIHYKNIEINIEPDKKYYETIQGFEKPIKMFAAPICS